MFSYSGFYNGTTRPQQHLCNVLHGLIPQLRMQLSALYPRRRRAPRLDESVVQGVPLPCFYAGTFIADIG